MSEKTLWKVDSEVLYRKQGYQHQVDKSIFEAPASLILKPENDYLCTNLSSIGPNSILAEGSLMEIWDSNWWVGNVPRVCDFIKLPFQWCHHPFEPFS